jgi:hypothetical protein
MDAGTETGRAAVEDRGRRATTDPEKTGVHPKARPVC